MSFALVVLCLAAFCLAGGIASLSIRVMLPFIDRVAQALSPRHRVRLWLGVVSLPLAVGLMAVAASLLPGFGLGHDHCLAHGPHHPHLCSQHVGSFPGVALVALAALVFARAAFVLFNFMAQLHQSRNVSDALAQASDEYEGVRVFASTQPAAFVLGFLKPEIHVSTGLLALGPDLVTPVVAHERIHARRRDLLWRALCPMFALGHLPFMLRALNDRLATAQELAADDEAASHLSDGRLRIAEALIALAKLARTPSPGIAFTDGDLKTRVHALLDGRAFAGWPAMLLLTGGLALPLLLGLSREFIHHGLETLLGALSH